MSDHHDLGRALRERADTMNGDEHPLSLADVKGRARGIRRRRVAVSGLAAAAVIAVAVPAGLVVADHTTSQSDLPPAATTPSPDSSASPDPTDSPTDGPSEDASPDVRTVTLDNDVTARSGGPGVDYLIHGDVVSPDSGATTIRLPNGDPAAQTRPYDVFARAGDTWLALWRDDQGRSFVDFVKRDGTVFDTRRATSSLAESQDGSIALYGTPEGKVVSYSAADDNLGMNDPATAPPDVEPVGVIGSGTCKEGDPEGGGCAVFFNDWGSDAAGYYATSHGIGSRLGHFRKITGVSPDGWISGIVSATDTGSCSVVWGADWSPSWKTCDYQLGKFSPDGKYVLGSAAYGDGIGASDVAILDAATGQVLVDYRNDAEAQAFVNNAVWDTDGTVLATVFARGRWTLMRMTPGGDLSVVQGMESLGTDMDTVPLVLGTRP